MKQTQIFFEYEPSVAYRDDAKRELFCARLPEARAARIRSPRSSYIRAERAACEAAFRRACKQAGEPYASLQIAYTENGKPYVAGRPDLSVSFSHTHTLSGAVLVKSSHVAPLVGLDLVECNELPSHATEIAGQMFCDFDRDLPSGVSGAEAFFCAWSRFEARVKMTGEGIGGRRNLAMPQTIHTFLVFNPGVVQHYVSIALDESDVPL